MNASRTVVIVTLLFLGGCGGCHQGSDSPEGGAAAPMATAEPLRVQGKIQVAPVEANRVPNAPRQVPGTNLTVTPMMPGDGGEQPAADETPEPEETDQGDCIAVADASPDYGPPPLSVTFSVEAECSAGQPTYKWNFGDGSPVNTEANPAHTYAKPGEYTASVTVTGPGGTTASDEVDITVEEGEAEPPQQ